MVEILGPPSMGEFKATRDVNVANQAQPTQSVDADAALKFFELSVFIPRPQFCPEVKLVTDLNSNGNQNHQSNYIELTLPVHGPETMRELQQSLLESTEGWWLGAVSLASVELGMDGKPDPKKLSNRTVFGDFTELATAFDGKKFQDPTIKRALLAVNIDYTEHSARFHVIRMRDVLYSQALGLLVGQSTPIPAYEPSQLGISGGTSLFPLLQASINRENGPSLAPSDQAVIEVQKTIEETNTISGKSKKKKKSLQTATSSASPVQPASGSPCDDSEPDIFADYHFDLSKPLAAFDSMRQDRRTEVKSKSPIQCLRTFALSNWNPPPHHYRLRGHYLYLELTTLENESFHLTCHTQGFFVNKSTKSAFDPSPRHDPRLDQVYYHTLSHLICLLSPLFVKQITSTWNSALTPAFPDFFTSIAITNCLPAFPWLVNPEQPFPDGIRSQLAYLITGSMTAETLPPARDWADEFAQTREQPRKTLTERILRERIWSRLQSDFSLAATRGVIGCSRGEVPPLNPQEPELAWTYILNNILFSRAEDPIGAYEHLGGTTAARAIANKDLQSIKDLNELDIPGIYTMATAVIDYHGKRWIAQGMIPGIFRPPDLEAESLKKAQKPNPQSNHMEVQPNNKEEVGLEKNNAFDQALPQHTSSGQPEFISSPATYDILYGSADIEKPEMGLRSDPKFHQLAAHVAAGFSLAEHSVTDLNGQEHRLWLSADVHGIRATDGRFYLIDLYRMTPLDVLFVENDLNGPILNGAKHSIDQPINCGKSNNDNYPHRFTVIRKQAILAFKKYKFRQFALKQLEQHSTQTDSQLASNLAYKTEDLKVLDGIKEAPADAEGVIMPIGGSDDLNATHKSGASADLNATFNFGLNPDAFVDRRGQPWIAPDQTQDDSIVMVRELSAFLRDQLLSCVIQELSDVKLFPPDGRGLSDLLHSYGVNIRYIGHITHRLQLAANDIEATKGKMDDQIVTLQAAIGMLHREMVFRACKHILNSLLTNTSESEACSCISHFLNCLLGRNSSAPISMNHSDWSEDWRSLTCGSLQSQIIAQIRRRFRYALPTSFFTQRLPQAKFQMLREICTRMGIQLALRDYQLYPPTSDLPSNGQLHSTDDETSPECPTTTVSVPKLAKKKKKSKSKKGATEYRIESTPGNQIFSADDILNLLPIVRDSTCRSTVADELYSEGRKAFAAGNVTLGQELCSDALSTYEQVFGSIHPEICRHWHSLALLYYQLSQRTLIELSEYSDRLLELSAIYHATKNEEDKKKIKEKIDLCQKGLDAEAAKNEFDTYIQLAANNLRQSIIVAERTLGLDHPETVQQYCDLSVMEYHLGNTAAAKRYTKHALDLWRLIYGPECHPDASAAVTHVAVLNQSTLGSKKSSSVDPIFELSRSLVGSFFGKDSAKFAEATMLLSQTFAQAGQRDLATQYSAEAAKLYINRFGEDHEQTKQAHALHEAITRSIEAQIQGDKEKSARLAKRLGLAPERAASLKARLLASTSSTSSSAVSSPRTHTESAQILRESSLQKVSKNSVPTGEPLSIDELVKYIQGSPDKSTSSKIKTSPPAAQPVSMA
ncbi:hypothetical protein O181_015899 [Austropuccinia psidii MF-1]|uniref:Clu domain-containing protein n=1 Tax=Austropuccinia psidii MF-1 TaxID=1389203 RepID=A0A9Q3GR97_9BASI|nr:hypothetical protein [Austropuccinia psidii MF-1]